MTAALAADSSTAAQTILQRCVCLMLSCDYLGNYRRIELRAIDMQKDGETLTGEKDEIGAIKRLFSAADLRPCVAAIASVKNRLRALSVDGGMRLFGAGAYLIPVGAVAEAERACAEGQALVTEKANELADRLPTLIEQRKAKLGPVFNAAEYPTADEVRTAYYVDWSYVSFRSPERLEEVDRAIADASTAKWEAKLASAYEDVLVGLRSSALRVMQELADRLRPGDDNKPKALRATALRDLQDLLGHLPVLNITEDDPLMDVMAGVAAKAQGLDVETLKSAPAVRAMLLATAEEACSKLGGLVTSGRRAMSFGAGPVGA